MRAFSLCAIAVLSLGEAAFAQDRMIWKGPALVDWRETDRLEMHGLLDDGQFKPTSVARSEPPGPAAPLLVPIDEDILPLAQARAFGVEERVDIHRSDGAVAIACRPGNAPAGVILHWPGRRLPRYYSGQWLLDGNSDKPVGLSSVAAGDDAPDASAARWTGGPQVLASGGGREQVLVLACPKEGAVASLQSLRLRPDRAGEVPIISRGTWVWHEQDWSADPAGFARAASAAGWSELAIQLPAVPGRALAQLARALGDKGIALRILDGYPAMATTEGLDAALVRLKLLRRWWDSRVGQGRLPMLELDIEPYGQPGFASDPAGGWQGWARAITTLAQAWGAPVAADVPWWMVQSPEGAAALRAARASLHEVIVMAYRTDPQLILDAAEPWLSITGLPIQVAIETGPVAAEVTRIYRRASRGTLRVGDDGVALLAVTAAAERNDAMFDLVDESVTDPRRVSFQGVPDLARQVEERLLPLLAGWPGFAGFRVHGWRPPS